MRKRISYALGIAAAVALVLVLFITSLDLVAFNSDFYRDEYRKLKRADSIGISEDELMKATNKLLDYMQDKTDNLNIKAKILGHQVEVFGERDKAHMVDVKNLYLFWRDFRNISAVAVVLIAALIVLLMRRDAGQILARSFLIGAGAVTAILLLVGLWVALDFQSFWTMFHHIFFTNDLWILDPQQSVLIQMVPLEFFFDVVTRILTYFGLSVLLLFLLSVITLSIRRRRRETLLAKGGKR